MSKEIYWINPCQAFCLVLFCFHVLLFLKAFHPLYYSISDICNSLLCDAFHQMPVFVQITTGHINEHWMQMGLHPNCTRLTLAEDGLPAEWEQLHSCGDIGTVPLHLWEHHVGVTLRSREARGTSAWVPQNWELLPGRKVRLIWCYMAAYL